MRLQLYCFNNLKITGKYVITSNDVFDILVYRVRIPGAAKLDKLAETRGIDSFIKKERAFSLLEFWKMQGYKIKNAGERLTSLSIIKHY